MKFRMFVAIVALYAGVAQIARAAGSYSYNPTSAPSDQFRLVDPVPSLPAVQAQAIAPAQDLPPESNFSPINPTNSPALTSQGRAIAEAPATSNAIQSSSQPPPEECLNESTLYTRVDYFHWNETSGGQDFVSEGGPMVTLGYQFRHRAQRWRAEVFGAETDAGYQLAFPGDPDDFVTSYRSYLGTREEYELIYDPQIFPSLSIFGGLGSRFWIRNIPNTLSKNDYAIGGYEEKWWTLYPYIGLETRRTMDKDAEFFFMGRIGLTAYTLETATVTDLWLNPTAGATGQLEGGIRGQAIFLSAFFEGMGWGESAQKLSGGFYWSQPKSQFYTIGLKTGYAF